MVKFKRMLKIIPYLVVLLFAFKMFSNDTPNKLEKSNKEFKDIGSPICFDVNTKGNIALLFKKVNFFSDDTNYFVNVYSKDAKFLFGLSYYDSGDSTIQYSENDNIEIIHVRGDVKEVIGNDGKRIKNVEMDSEKAVRITTDHERRKMIKLDNVIYQLNQNRTELFVNEVGKKTVIWKE